MRDISKSSIPGHKWRFRLTPRYTTLSPIGLTVLASIIASIGGILFGYDIGIISGALLLLRKEFTLSDFDQEMVVSSMLIGSLFGAFFGGSVVDRFGRRQGIIFSGILFVAGALILSCSINFPMLLSGRFILGVAVSVSVTAECTYISEISMPGRRGMLVSLNEVGITVGFLLAYLFDYLLISNPHGWQYMFAVAIVPALLQMVGIFLMPPSPHYLLTKGKVSEAKGVLKLIRKADYVDDEIKAIQLALNEEKNKRYIDLISPVNNMRGRLLLGMVLVFLQQFSGHANVLYYAPTVFQQFGYCSDTSATFVTIGLGIVKVLSTTFTLITVDKFGRRCLLLVGCLLMACSIIILGITAAVKPEFAPCSAHPSSTALNETRTSPNDNLTSVSGTSDLTSTMVTIEVNNLVKLPYQNESKSAVKKSQISLFDSSNRTFLKHNDSENLDKPPPPKDISLVVKVVSVVSLMVFVCAYGISYGPVTWLILSEIYPTALRGRAISIATCVNWGSNIIVSVSFLSLLNAVGIGITFILYGCLCIIAFAFVLLFLPETKNKTLEEINCQLSQGFLQLQITSCGTSECHHCSAADP